MSTQRRSLVMAVKYSFVARGHDILATKILEGKYKDVIYQVGRIQFSEPNEDGTRHMRFKHQILENKRNVTIEKDFTSMPSDIIVEQIEEKLEKGNGICKRHD